MDPRVLIIITALVCAALLGGCSALICNPWDPRCDVSKGCSDNKCSVDKK